MGSRRSAAERPGRYSGGLAQHTRLRSPRRCSPPVWGCRRRATSRTADPKACKLCPPNTTQAASPFPHLSKLRTALKTQASAQFET
jgi:hypothetical protein